MEIYKNDDFNKEKVIKTPFCFKSQKKADLPLLNKGVSLLFKYFISQGRKN